MALGHSTSQHSTSQHSTSQHSKKDVKQELETCSKEMMKLKDQEDTLHRYKASLIGTQSDIKELSSKMTTFADIWWSVSQATYTASAVVR